MSSGTGTNNFAKLTHGNYHAWVPQMTAELQQLGVWRFCMGDESIPATKPIAPTVLNNAGIAEKAVLDRNFTDTMHSYSDACCCNNQAIGLIMMKVEPSEYKDLENKSAKEVWDTLKMWHADMLKYVVFAMGWKEELRTDLEQAKTHKHQHQI